MMPQLISNTCSTSEFHMIHSPDLTRSAKLVESELGWASPE
jgi:hypothetical protein